MVASSVSLNALSTTLGRPMDIIPLRPNIVLGPSWSLSPIQPWAEDFWSELKFGTKGSFCNRFTKEELRSLCESSI